MKRTAWLLTAFLTTQSAVSWSLPAQEAKQITAAKGQAKPAAKPAIEPTFADVPYGSHPRQVLDFWKAESDKPTPLVLFIHGGGWSAGDKSNLGTIRLKDLLDQGISVAAINYRLIQQADEAGINPPVQWPLEDAARSLQFLRSKAAEWNIDKVRIGATGGSAGGASSLWLAMHDDMANPNSDDPVARESTRLFCAAVVGAQTTLDPKQTRAAMPNMIYGGHAFGFRKPGQPRDGEFQAFLEHRDDVLPWIKEYSPLEHASADDPPLFLDYPAQDKPPVKGETQKDPTHSALLGVLLKERLDPLGVEARLSYPGHADPTYSNVTDYLIARLKGD